MSCVAVTERTDTSLGRDGSFRLGLHQLKQHTPRADQKRGANHGRTQPHG